MADNRNSPPIPPHHAQWFEELTRAFANDDVALMSCLDAKTAEPRSVICMVQREKNGNFEFIPVGYLCPEPNPFEAYIPPETASIDNGSDGDEDLGQITKRTLN